MSDNSAKRIVNNITKISHIVGQSVTMIMLLLITADVIMRYVFNDPIGGVLELTKLMMVVLVFLSFAYVELKDAHVRVDLVISRLKPKVRACIECFNAFLSIFVFAIIAWQSIPRALYMIQKGDITGYLHIPEGPFFFFITFGCLLICFQLIFRLWRFVTQARIKG
jgi:TRAP-type C4-dicarboxylate transport system permease small subunit